MNTVRLSNISLKDFKQFLFDSGCSRIANGTKGRGEHEKLFLNILSETALGTWGFHGKPSRSGFLERSSSLADYHSLRGSKKFTPWARKFIPVGPYFFSRGHSKWSFWSFGHLSKSKTDAVKTATIS